MWDEIKNFFATIINQIDYIQIGIFVLIMIVGLILRKVAMRSVKHFFVIIDKKTKTDLFEKYLKPILRPIGNFILLLALYISVKVITIPDKPIAFKLYIGKLLSIFLILNMAWFLLRITSLLTLYLKNITSKTDSKLDDQLVPILSKFLRIIIFTISGLLIVQNFGYSVSGVVAGLGIGGFALAFAAKDALANIFGSLIIFLDRPFQIGDWIKTSGIEGVVEEVGLRSTKIRTFEKTLVSIPNNKISNSTIENVSERPRRRIKFIVGLSYAAKPDQIKKAISEMKEILIKQEGVDPSTIIVRFTEFNASTLDLLVYCFLKTPEWSKYLEIREEINYQIMHKLDELGLEMAFPSQSIYVEKMPS